MNRTDLLGVTRMSDTWSAWRPPLVRIEQRFFAGSVVSRHVRHMYATAQHHSSQIVFPNWQVFPFSAIQRFHDDKIIQTAILESVLCRRPSERMLPLKIRLNCPAITLFTLILNIGWCR